MQLDPIVRTLFTLGSNRTTLMGWGGGAGGARPMGSTPRPHTPPAGGKPPRPSALGCITIERGAARGVGEGGVTLGRAAAAAADFARRAHHGYHLWARVRYQRFVFAMSTVWAWRSLKFSICISLADSFCEHFPEYSSLVQAYARTHTVVSIFMSILGTFGHSTVTSSAAHGRPHPRDLLGTASSA